VKVNIRIFSLSKRNKGRTCIRTCPAFRINIRKIKHSNKYSNRNNMILKYSNIIFVQLIPYRPPNSKFPIKEINPAGSGIFEILSCHCNPGSNCSSRCIIVCDNQIRLSEWCNTILLIYFSECITG